MVVTAGAGAGKEAWVDIEGLGPAGLTRREAVLA